MDENKKVKTNSEKGTLGKLIKEEEGRKRKKRNVIGLAERRKQGRKVGEGGNNVKERVTSISIRREGKEGKDTDDEGDKKKKQKNRKKMTTKKEKKNKEKNKKLRKNFS